MSGDELQQLDARAQQASIAIEGRIDAYKDGRLRGWAWSPQAPARAVVLDVLIGGRIAASFVAHRFREDLRKLGKRDGWCAFDAPVDLSGFASDLPVELEVRALGGLGRLKAGPLKIESFSSPTRFGAGAGLVVDPKRAAQFTSLVLTELRTPEIKGKLLEVGPKWVRGWAVRPRAPGSRVELRIVVDGLDVGSVVAEDFLPDLAVKRRGDGRCGFAFKLPKAVRDGQAHRLELSVDASAHSATVRPIGVRVVDGVAIVEEWLGPAPGESWEDPAPPRSRPVSDVPSLAAGRERSAKDVEATAALGRDEPTPPRTASETPALPPYLESQEELARLASWPWEQLLAVAPEASDAAVQGLVERLRRERGAAQRGPRETMARLLVLDGAQQSPAQATGDAWALQSEFRTEWKVIDSSESPGSEWMQEHLSGTGWRLFARAGDAIHPCAVALLGSQFASADVVVWNLLVSDEFDRHSAIVYRRPAFDPHTFRHNPSIDTTFAVRAEALKDCPEAVLDALLRGRIHPLLFWLSGQSQLLWRVCADALTVRSKRAVPLQAATRIEVEKDLDLYVALTDQIEEGFRLRETEPELPFPFVLTPRQRAAEVSVVLPLQGASLEDCLAALFDFARQRVIGNVEIVLVGAPSAQAPVIAGAAHRMFGPDCIRLVQVDAPGLAAFLNAGAEAARGEALVFCSPALRAPPHVGLLEELTAWALVPGVGLVGAALEDRTRPGCTAFGLRLMQPGPDLFAPVMAPDEEESFADALRSCAGHPWALAAMARSKFRALGGFADRLFPRQGFAEDLALRCTRSGLVHIYLGHLRAALENQANPLQDPIVFSQLRQLYPESAEAWLFALQRQVVKRPSADELILPEDVKLLAEAATRQTGLDDELRASLLEQVAKVTEAGEDLVRALERLYAMATRL